MPFELPALPYSINALAPNISEETLEFHYGKHHQTYVTNLNNLTADNAFADQSLEEIIKNSTGGIFNNAAQVWNHTFYWHCLTPEKTQLSDALKQAIEHSFGSLAEFKEHFCKAAITTFGSGWAWLVKNNVGELEIISTSNANNPLTEDKTPLLTCDVWEHAYYIDYRNARPAYVDKYFELINWDFVSGNFDQ